MSSSSSSNNTSLFSGRCNCSSLIFRAPPPSATAVCFCKCCVRGGGSTCSYNAVIPVDGLVWEKKGTLKEYTDEETSSGQPMKRLFCGQCGSPILSIPHGSEIAYFKLSSLDDVDSYIAAGKAESELKTDPSMVIFTGKAPGFFRTRDVEKDGLKWPEVGETNYQA